MIAAGYVRVSSEKQSRDNRVSIPEQRRLIEARAAQDGLTISLWYDDHKPYRSAISNRIVQPSGTRPDRPGFVAALKAMQAGDFSVLYAWSQDRLARGAAVTAQLRDAAEAARCEIRLVVGVWDADTAELLGAVSGLELRRIKQRMALGRVGRFRKGLAHAAPADCYDIVRDAEGHSVGYRLTDQGRAILSEVARLVIAGESYYSTARKVGRLESWVSDSVRLPFYRGFVSLNGERRRGGHEPAWDEATGRALDREIARRRVWAQSRPRRKPNGQGNLFAGLLRCGYCGGWMRVNNQVRGKRCYLGYACARPYRRSASHPPNTVMESVLVAALRLAMESIDDDDEFLSLVSGRQAREPEPDPRIEQLRRQAAELERALEAVRDMPAAERSIEADLERVRGDIESAIVEQAGAPQDDDPQAASDAIHDLRSSEWWTIEREHARALLRSAIRELWVISGEIVKPPDIS